MAEKRMFTKRVCESDKFLAMSLSAQALYMHLCLNADDDGFVGNPITIQRMIGASIDDYKLLVMKGFVIEFGTGVNVITHWKINNNIRSDRYKETLYLEEKSMLDFDKINGYEIKEELNEIMASWQPQKMASLASWQPQKMASLASLASRQPEKMASCASLKQENYKKEKNEKFGNTVISSDCECFYEMASCHTNGSDSAPSDIDIDIDILSLSDSIKNGKSDNLPDLSLSNYSVEVMNKWNELNVYGVSNIRLDNKLLTELEKKFDLQYVLQAIDKIKESDYLLGKTPAKINLQFRWFARNVKKINSDKFKNYPKSKPTKKKYYEGESTDDYLKRNGFSNLSDFENELVTT